MKTKYIKIPVSERLPEKSGYYDTDCGNIYFKRTKQRTKWKEYEDEYGEGEFPEYWLEEKEDHSEEMLSLLEEIIDAQYNPEISLSELNTRIRKAKEFLNEVDNGK